MLQNARHSREGGNLAMRHRFEDYPMNDKCCKKLVIPANAGIQWLSPNAAGSPLTYQNTRGRRYSEFERHALL